MTETEDSEEFGTEEVEQLEEFEEKAMEIWDGLFRSYCAGFSQAADSFDIDADFSTDVRSLQDNPTLAKTHYNYWDGRPRPLFDWLAHQYDFSFEDLEAHVAEDKESEEILDRIEEMDSEELRDRLFGEQ